MASRSARWSPSRISAPATCSSLRRRTADRPCSFPSRARRCPKSTSRANASLSSPPQVCSNSGSTQAIYSVQKRLGPGLALPRTLPQALVPSSRRVLGRPTRGRIMSQDGSVAAPCDAPLFSWLGPLGRFAELGTAGYPRGVRRRLTIVNAMAFLIAVFSVIYACVFAYYDMHDYRHLIALNLLLTVIVLLVPLAHRINDIAAALAITVAEYVALFVFV